MKLKLTWQRPGGEHDDILVSLDHLATVGDLARAMSRSDPKRGVVAPPASPTLSVQAGAAGPAVLPTDAPVLESGLRSGAVVSVTAGGSRFASGDPSGPAAATLIVTGGPDQGRSFPLRGGTSYLGRDRSCEVRLTDPLVSKVHLKINVSEVVELVDNNSSNGILVDGDLVQRFVIRPDTPVLVGDSTVVITSHVHHSVTSTATTSSIEFNRSPRLDPAYQGIELVAPEPPQRFQSPRFPFIPMVAPVVMGCVMFAITRNPLSVVFVALSPLMLVGSYFENRVSGKKAFARATEQFRVSLADLAVQLEYASERERIQRCAEHPSTAEVAGAIERLSPLLWTRRPEHRSFMQLRLGLGMQPSRNTVKLPTTNNTIPVLWRELHEVVERFANVDHVPIVGDFRDAGAVGVSGSDQTMLPYARSIVVQLVGLHSPAEVVLAAVASAGSARHWEWLKWLPHTSSDHSPLGGEHLVTSPTACTNLIAGFEELVEQRSASTTRREGELPLPVIVLLVEDDAPIERSRFVELAEIGASQGVFLLWVAPSTERLPAVCRTYLAIDPNTGSGAAGFVRLGSSFDTTDMVAVDDGPARALARRMAPLVDAGARVDDASDLPRTVAFLGLAGTELADSSESVLERWRENHSVMPRDGSRLPRRKKDNNLRALVGMGATDNFYLDLRTQGPHALVGGTTGAGKSEFLQTWILGMAAAHSPDRVTFLFVDYKGGSAFADCLDLPHTVGLVTDLSPHLVRRALTSLNAELRNREHILNRRRAKDLLELERRGDVDAPPSLVIVVDEFAALVSEVPEFVDGVVNVAQRGRSLGLHLILATQRPAGVIKDNLRANTNLRVALRMADETDSTDVIGVSQAATFDPSIPGRAAAKTGPGRLTAFQSGYVGGWTSNEPPSPMILIEEFPFGVGATRDDGEAEVVPEIADLGPTDIRRLVDSIVGAHALAAIPTPRKPWLPALADVYELADLPMARVDRELVFGVLDDPVQQQQPTVAFLPRAPCSARSPLPRVSAFAAGPVGFTESTSVRAGFRCSRTCRTLGASLAVMIRSGSPVCCASCAASSTNAPCSTRG
jgi:DNA segregation ATPase FtsK/SpoIIIE, S-DNA-T family